MILVARIRGKEKRKEEFLSIVFSFKQLGWSNVCWGSFIDLELPFNLFHFFFILNVKVSLCLLVVAFAEANVGCTD